VTYRNAVKAMVHLLWLFLRITDTAGEDSKVSFRLWETWRVVDLAGTRVAPRLFKLEAECESKLAV
jgi:hypothetical protein